MKKFKILLVNDDGYDAEGIKLLDSVLTEDGHEVWVLAPESQRSACSHAISLHKRVKIVKISDRHYYCDGFPADCVLFADRGAIPDLGKPDLVISGINHGFNIGTDLVYSATVGGASEGAVRGYPSIAISCARTNGNTFPYADSAEFLRKHLHEFFSVCKTDCFININVPECSNLKWSIAGVGNTEYYDNLVKYEDIDEFSINGTPAPDLVSKNISNTDFELVSYKSTIAVSMVKVIPAVDEEGQKLLEALIK